MKLFVHFAFKRKGLCFLLFSLFVLDATPNKAFAAGSSIFLKGGTVYTITGPILEGADIIIKDGIIEKIGHNLKAPEGIKVVDCKGKVILPGFVIAESVWGFGTPPYGVDVFSPTFPLVLGSGVTTVRSGSYAVKLTYRDPKGLLLSSVRFVRLPLTSWSGRAQLRRSLLKAREALRRMQQKGGEKAKGSIYVDLLQKKVKAWADADRAQDILAACSLAREFDFPLVISGGIESWAVAEEIGRTQASVILSIRRITGPRRDPDSPPGSNVRACAILRKAGVPFALVPPDLSLSITRGFAGRDITSLAMEAAFAVRGGLDESTALQAITIEPAKILGVSHRIGSVEEGKDGDLIVLTGNPLDYKTAVELAIINGKIYYDRSRSDLLPKPGTVGKEPP